MGLAWRRTARVVAGPFRTPLGQRLVERAVLAAARLSGLNLQDVTDRSIGVGKYQDSIVSGEYHVLERVLPLLMPTDRAVLFDIGANCGTYASCLRKMFPSARIIAFEPNPHAFARLNAATAELTVDVVNAAVGAAAGRAVMFDYAGGDGGSEHASMHKSVLTELHHADTIEEIAVDLLTLDDFCDSAGVERIDFLKIDTEGHELEVLRGAERLLKADMIGVIQFEFNEMNVASRSFLRDFYDRLPRHRFYRLDTGRLVALGDYSPRYEVFRFQNFLAVPATAGPLI